MLLSLLSSRITSPLLGRQNKVRDGSLPVREVKWKLGVSYLKQITYVYVVIVFLWAQDIHPSLLGPTSPVTAEFSSFPGYVSLIFTVGPTDEHYPQI